jgi:hypothetical protein
MSNDALAASSWRLWWVVAAIMIIFIISLLPGGEDLLLGWLYFPLGTIPRMTVDWPAALLGLASFIAFVGGLHLAVRAFFRGASTGSAFQWSFRSTLAVALALLLMFAAGTAIVGATHQAVWLALGRTSKSSAAGRMVYGFRNSARSSLHRTSESSNLKDIALAVQNFHDTFQGLPPGGTMTENGELLHGWAIFAGPFTGFGIYAHGLDFAVPWNQPPNDRFYKCGLWMFTNPAIRGPHFDANGYGYAHVAANVHVLPIRTVRRSQFRASERGDAPMRQIRETNQNFEMRQITDGASNTLLVGTVTERFKPWGHPANIRDPGRGIDRSPNGFGGPPQWGGAMFSFCDGHTAVLNRKIDPKVLRALATPAGGERIGDY